MAVHRRPVPRQAGRRPLADPVTPAALQLQAVLYPARVQNTAAALVPYDIGEVAVVHAVLLADGEPVTPTEVLLRAVGPSGAAVVYTPTPAALNEIRVMLSAPGRWKLIVSAARRDASARTELLVWVREP